MRTALFHILALIVTVALYCLIVPQAREELLSDVTLREKMEGVGVRMLCVYACFLFVYYTLFRAKKPEDEMPDTGAYGGYRDADDDPA